jgi:hypothetical protein
MGEWGQGSELTFTRLQIYTTATTVWVGRGHF